MKTLTISFMDVLMERSAWKWVGAILSVLTIVLLMSWQYDSQGPENDGCQPGQGQFITQSVTPDSLAPCMSDLIMGGEYEAIPPAGITIIWRPQ